MENTQILFTIFHSVIFGVLYQNLLGLTHKQNNYNSSQTY